MKIYQYRGYNFKYNYSANTKTFYAELINCPDLVAFQFRHIGDLKPMAELAIDDYIQLNEENLILNT